MADPAELTPAELDRLEDALESLADVDEIADESAQVRERLGDYKQLLLLAREAQPLEEPPASVLAAVMAEARAAVESERVEPAASTAPSMWTKLRRAFLVPGLALAGAAALVVLVFVPADRAGAPETVARVDERRAEPVVLSEPASASPKGAVRQEAAGGEALEAKLEEQTVATPPASAAEPAEEASKSADGSSVVGGVPGGTATPTAAGTTPRWDIIARGDRERRKSNCTLARKEYDQALADADATVRARAHAGIGLCQSWSGDQEGADDSYARARELDPEIAKFIADERPRGARPVPQAKPSKKAKAGPPKAAQSVDEADAFK